MEFDCIKSGYYFSRSGNRTQAAANRLRHGHWYTFFIALFRYSCTSASQIVFRSHMVQPAQLYFIGHFATLLLSFLFKEILPVIHTSFMPNISATSCCIRWWRPSFPHWRSLPTSDCRCGNRNYSARRRIATAQKPTPLLSSTVICYRRIYVHSSRVRTQA